MGSGACLFINNAQSLKNSHVAFSRASTTLLLSSSSCPSSTPFRMPRRLLHPGPPVLPHGNCGAHRGGGGGRHRLHPEDPVQHPLSRGVRLPRVFDIHALQERFYFGDTVLPLFESGIPLLKAELERHASQGEDIVIAYPDKGAWKRFHMFSPLTRRSSAPRSGTGTRGSSGSEGSQEKHV